MTVPLLFVIAASLAHAGTTPANGAGTSDVIGTAGEMGAKAGNAAIANRELSNQLYKSSLANEKAAWASTIPNVGLLVKALQQSKDAKAADDQAKEFARSALHASNTGAHSGDFVGSRYGMADESKLKELSSTSSPYMPQVEKSLGGYGMKLSADKMSLQTPMGNFALNDDSWLGRATGMLKKLGLPTGGLEAAQADAIRERDAMAKKIMAAIDAGGGKREPASASVAATAEDLNKAINAKDEPVKTAAQEAAPAAAPVTDWNAAEQALLANRKAMGREMGMESATDPLGRSTQDIFHMINIRYQSLNSEGVFLQK